MSFIRVLRKWVLAYFLRQRISSWESWAYKCYPEKQIVKVSGGEEPAEKERVVMEPHLLNLLWNLLLIWSFVTIGVFKKLAVVTSGKFVCGGVFLHRLWVWGSSRDGSEKQESDILEREMSGRRRLWSENSTMTDLGL
jgi:hypothetical protein